MINDMREAPEYFENYYLFDLEDVDEDVVYDWWLLNKNKNYNILTNNCADVVLNALEVGYHNQLFKQLLLFNNDYKIQSPRHIFPSMYILGDLVKP